MAFEYLASCAADGTVYVEIICCPDLADAAEWRGLTH